MLIDDDSDQKLVDLDEANTLPVLSPSRVVTGSSNAKTSMASGSESQMNAAAAAPPPPPLAGSTQQGGLDFVNSDYFVPPGGEAPPPDFAPYVADYFEDSEGAVITHDAHLNEDGMYR